MQLTKDKLPVVFHDFFVCTGRNHYMISGLSYVELSALVLENIVPSWPSPNPFWNGTKCTKCSTAVTNYHIEKHPIPLLKDVFQSRLELNVEVKYPTQDEEEDSFLATPVSICAYCSIIADHLENNHNGQQVVYSSFHPEICVWFRQNTKRPVMFLTDAGETISRFDERLNSLQAALDFAVELKLTGIVSNAVGLLKSDQELLDKIKAHHMLLYSYGRENCDAELVTRQVKMGVDGIITDDLPKIIPLQ